jgi:hypothetical protein
VSKGPEAGRLDRAGNWLICEQCDRAYPIRDNIPVMLIEEGDRFRVVPRSELPAVPPPEIPVDASEAPPAPQGLADEQALILALVGLLLGLGLVLLFVLRAKKKRAE